MSDGTIFFRPGTGDEKVLQEVLYGRSYRKQSVGFDVEPGEKWLDLGANIGAFSLYCKSRGAVADCFEPDSACFYFLKLNVPEFRCANAAVTASREKTIPVFNTQIAGNYARLTEFPVNKYRPSGEVANAYAGLLVPESYDGVKMDIEGSEGAIIDQWLLPRCRKLVLEYHTSRDMSVGNFSRRVGILRGKFKHVDYPAELDRIVSEGYLRFEKWIRGANGRERFVQHPAADRLVFCWGPR
jgi:FkbM family methyltransferase